MGPPDSSRTPTGHGRLIGRYALFQGLASGGMATVHLGRLLGPAGFNRTVAIKRLHEQFAADPEFVAMFLDEARLAARIQHPNVVQTLDVVALDGELFIVMEYIHGESLSRLVHAAKSRGGIDPKLVATVVGGALHGLHAAHEAKSESGSPLAIVHRDVSPQNILVGVDGVSRVLDFGVAKAANRVHSTQGNTVKGKFRYMPPEQLRSEEVDRRADIYAAGVVLYEALTGRRYIEAEEHAAIVLEIVSKKPVAPSSHRADLPASLDAITMKALAPNPDDRFATAEEMSLALEDAVGLASPARVGKWVTEIAAVALSERAQRVKEVESFVSGVDVGLGSGPIRSAPPSERIGPPSLPSFPGSTPSIQLRPDLGDLPSRSGPVEATSPTNVSAAMTTAPAPERVHPLWYGVAAGAAIAAMMALTLVLLTRQGPKSDVASASGSTKATASAMPIGSAGPVASLAPTGEPPIELPGDEPSTADTTTDAGPTAAAARPLPAARPRPPSNGTPRPSTSTPEDLFRRRR